MKILIVHNRYRNRAGEDAVFDQEVKLLEETGHQVKTLIKDNLEIQSQTIQQKIILAINTIWSSKSYQDISKHLNEFKPDIVHVHNILPLLSPSIFYACKKQNIPVVQTIHNYRLGCPVGTFFRDGKICELCIQKSLLSSISYRCYHNSYFQTAIVAIMLQIHRWLGTWNNVVSAYIAVSPFVKQKLIEIGIPENKIYIKPNFVEQSPLIEKTPDFGQYYLYVGRLAEEKGISILLEGYQNSNSQYPLIIIGSGELQSKVEGAAKNNPQIQYLGQQTREQVLQYMRQAIALIFPSIWYEGFPVTILEAYSQSLPVVGSDIGSVSYAIRNHVTGLTYPAGDEKALCQTLSSIEADPKLWIELKKKIINSLHDIYFSKQNIDYLLEIYRNLMDS